MAELLVQGGAKEQVYELRDGVPLFVGRVVGCDIRLPSKAVSRRHAVFLSKEGESGVKDLDSVNGVRLNGRKLTGPIRLKDGDVLQIAEYRIVYRASAAEKKTRRGEDARHTTIFQTPPLVGRDVAAVPGGPDRAQAKTGKKGAKTTGILSPPPEPFPAAADATPEMFSPEADESAEAPADEFPSGAEPPPEPETRLAAASSRRSNRFFPPPKGYERPTIEIPDDDFGDGGDDDAFSVEETENDDDDGGAGVTKMAAEAGIVGEFAPDVEDDSAAAVVSDIVPVMPSGAYSPDPDALPIDDKFREAIETRLFLYSFLEDMREERAALLASRTKIPDAVKAELARQDREIDKIPSPEQAEGMIEKRRVKQEDLRRRVEEAKKSGEKPPKRPSRDMRLAEEMAITQWTFCIQAGREALPAVFGQGFQAVADEPLAGILEQSGVNPVELFGGAAYYLALESLLEETKAERQETRAKIAALAAPGEKHGGMFGFFGRGGAATPIAQDRGNREELAELEAALAARTAWLGNELVFMEKRLILEFWRVYDELALLFVPKSGEMPLSVRAFLRHGAIGFKKWWMKPEVRDHIIKDCSTDVNRRLEVGKGITNIVYADEYLAAVLNNECTPALDENLEINERNSPNWKADKALRRVIHCRGRVSLLEELMGELRGRVDKLSLEADGIDEQIGKLLAGSKNYKKLKNELGQKRQALKVEIAKLNNLLEKTRTETLENLRAGMLETEQRFASGELPMPGGEFLLRRECAAIRKIGRLLANLKEKFMPLALRDSFQPGTDAVNDRRAIAGEIGALERRDPAVFLETVVASKKRANRVDLRISPVIVLLPSAGVLAYSWNPRSGPETGRLAVPTCFIRPRLRERQLVYLLADFRWDTSKAAAGMDVMTSDTIVAAFMTVRWDWRKRSREAREKGLVYTDQNDRTNWRRVYEAYSQTAFDGGKKLYNRNYDFYERIIGKYFDLPDGVDLLRK